MADTKFTYNNEMLPDPDTITVANPEAALKDRNAVKEAFPDIWFALFVDGINDRFLARDKDALALKDTFVTRGTWAITLGVTALLVTFFQLLVLPILPITQAMDDRLRNILPWVAFIMFMGGIIISFRGGVGKRKLTWLGERMFLERIRCWRWQYFVATIPDIIDAIGDDDKKAAYLKHRKVAFDKAWSDLSSESHKAVKDMILSSQQTERDDALQAESDRSQNPEDGDLPDTQSAAVDRFNIKTYIDLNLVPSFKAIARRIQNDDAFETATEAHQRQIIRAYRDMRMSHQYDYAAYQVKHGVGKLNRHPGRQNQAFESLSNKLLFASIGFEFFLIILTVYKSITTTGAALPEWLVVCLALGQFAIFTVVAIAFGLKAMQHSLRTPVQVARLKGYRDEVHSIIEEYDTKNGPRIGNSIVSLERAAYNEMCEFIETGARSVFLL